MRGVATTADRTRAHAKRLRRSQTHAEDALWSLLRGRELDGGIHDAPFRDPERDRSRTAWLEGRGYRMLRFRNAELATDARAVLARILAEVRAHTPHPSAPPTPSPSRGEGL